MPRFPQEAYAKARDEAEKFLRRKGVVAVSLGLMQKGGEQTDRRAIVVLVDYKLQPAELRAQRRPTLPKSISVRVGNRTYEVPVDVQGTGGETIGRSQGLVCRKVHKGGVHAGAVGALVQWNTEVFLLTAGHVVVVEQSKCQVVGTPATIEAHAEKIWMGNSLDYALLRPSSPLAADAARLPNRLALTGVRPVTASLLNTTAVFRPASSMRETSVTILQVDATASFQLPTMSSPTVFRRMLGTEQKTIPGDSGTLLYDPVSRAAIGTLIGTFSNYSYFLPCSFNFGLLNFSLVT